ncbi:Flp pilus assembly protein CpaB [Streptomyces sp. RB6PN25]|uniref:Flp pilus assembly protein CpaB n=1 Tax=Streptomyces humicola TaxID=2953240 RepID=A0ABT1PX60_9ACTN|nr:Flp pilus assembly protein CpaB [Streptomyces humicola]MCQ4082251.1 Flp pilus assembly protein CpaB [Streptomyces humicola]
MNSRQRRGIILLVLSLLCAIVAFAGVFAVVANVESQVGPKVTAYRLTQDVPAYKALSADQVERIEIPQRWRPSTAVTDLSQLQGKIAATGLKRGSLLQTDMIDDKPQLAPGQMEIAIMIDGETGVAGQITPGSRVNIFATFASANNNGPDVSKIIVEDAQVMDVGQAKATSAVGGGDNSSDQSGNGSTTTQEVPITFALDAADAQRVAYAESFARHVRLALIAPGDTSTIPPNEQTYTLSADKGPTPAGGQ